MNHTVIKKLFAIAVLFVLLGGSFLEFGAYAAETPKGVDTTKVLDFLKNVVQLDIDKYETHLTSVSSETWTGGITLTRGKYTLDATGLGGHSYLEVLFFFWDNELTYCASYELSQGPALYLQEPERDLHKAASGFLQRYQTYTNDKQITQMINLLNAVDISTNNTKTDDTLQLTVKINDKNTYLTWGNVVNGIDYSRLGLTFEDGDFSYFGDDRAFYSLGSNVIEISEEQAVSIALECADGFSYLYFDEEISGFDIVHEHIRVLPGVQPRASEDPLVWYPCWVVDLPLSKIYPGSIYYIKVLLWADTGEVINVTPLGYGASDDYPIDDHAPPSATQDNNPASTNMTTVVYIVSVCIAIIISIAITTVVLKRRKK
ncbi:MAG: hypothetical protein LBH74_09900 [Nitrososphaerota archaeon]|jgi:hypothetical protein|nr:hypothetical protein [Nitrososphaerota archaeon]